MSGTLIMNLLATLFMTQLMYVIGVGGTQVSRVFHYCFSSQRKKNTVIIQKGREEEICPTNLSTRVGNEPETFRFHDERNGYRTRYKSEKSAFRLPFGSGDFSGLFLFPLPSPCIEL